MFYYFLTIVKYVNFLIYTAKFSFHISDLNLKINKFFNKTYFLTIKNTIIQIKICAILSEKTGNSIENFPIALGSSKYHAFGTQFDTFV